MGKLRRKKIEFLRSWIEPTITPIPDLDYEITFPVTVYEAVRRNEDDDSTTLDAELTRIYQLLEDKQDSLDEGAPGTLMSWSGIKGQVGEVEIVREINADPNDRSLRKVVSERAVGNALDLKANAVDLNLHIRDFDSHVTEDEKIRWNEMTPLEVFEEHEENEEIHVTQEERESWNNRASQYDLEHHILDYDNPHRVTAHQIGSYSRSEIDDMFASLRESFFSYRNIEYDSRTNIATLVEYDSDNWNPNYVLSYGEDLPKVTDQSLTYFAIKPVTDYATNESSECIIYMKQPGTVWQEVGLVVMEAGDMVIRYPDTTMCVWIQGRFMSLFTDSSASSGYSEGGNGKMWRPTVSENGVLGWTLSSEIAPPDPVVIKGPAGHTPVKGVDYHDGAAGIGVPSGGKMGQIIAKSTSDDYDTEWVDFPEYIRKYVNEDGSIPGLVSSWEDLQDAPIIYDELGEDENGLVNQKTLSNEFNNLKERLNELSNELGSTSGLGGLSESLNNHLNDFNNPHRVTASSIGAVPLNTFVQHSQNFDNPHSVTAAQVGLGNVNNTSDMNKPISIATQLALNEIRESLDALVQTINGGTLVSDVQWDEARCTLTFLFRNGEDLDAHIPIMEIFRTLSYDDINHEIVIVLPDGSEHRISIGSLITVYDGSTGNHIKIEVIDGRIIGTILPDSITGDELKESIHLRNSPTTTTQLPSDKSDKIATTKFVKNVVKDDLISYESDRPLSANMGRLLNLNKTDIEDVLQIIADSLINNVLDTLGSTDEYSALSANMGRELNLTKAPMIHTSPSGSTFGRATQDLFGHVRAGSMEPLMDGVPFVGTDNGYYARSNHRHPSDISRAPMHWPDTEHGQYKMTGEPRAETPPVYSDDDRIATTEWVRTQLGGGFEFMSDEDIETTVNNVYTAVIGKHIIYESLSQEDVRNRVINIFRNIYGDDVEITSDTINLMTDEEIAQLSNAMFNEGIISGTVYSTYPDDVIRDIVARAFADAVSKGGSENE